MKKWEISGERVTMYISDSEYYQTNREGNGIFLVDLVRNKRKQLAGTCDFTVRGIKPESKKAKLRTWLRDM